jgi:hypothetical protein
VERAVAMTRYPRLLQMRTLDAHLAELKPPPTIAGGRNRRSAKAKVQAMTRHEVTELNARAFWSNPRSGGFASTAAGRSRIGG